MMINKLQTAEDIRNFRKLPGEELEAILRDTPGHVVDVIVDVLKAFLLKMNVPVPETEKLTGKVREKKMGELFANMEKMDIQAERRNTALEKERADKAEKRADAAEKRADLAEENSIKLLVEFGQELGATIEATVQSLMEKKYLSRDEALAKTRLYWKSGSAVELDTESISGPQGN